jgi:hypothetical protein
MLTWGVSDYEGNERYEMSLQFPNNEYASNDTTNFMNNMIDLETKLKADAISNAKEWFGKAKMSQDAIDALWTPMLKYPKDKNTLEPDTTRAPTLKVKIPFWEGEWKTELYNVDQEPIYPDPNGGSMTPKDLILKGTHVAVVLQCGGLWFANGKFGVTWRLLQGVVKPKETMKGKCHILLSTEDKAKLESQKASDEDVEELEDTSHVVEDSDNEDTVKEDTFQDDTVKEEVAVEIAAAVVDEAPKKKIIKKKITKKAD